MEQKTFLELLAQYMESITDADPLFTKFMGVQLLGHLLSKNSHINVTPGIERMNLYITLVGSSILARKTLVQESVMYLYPENKVLPNESTAEKFIDNLAQTPDGIWSYGELSTLLKHIKGRSYLSTVSEVMNNLYRYEGKVYTRDTKGGGKVSIPNPYPSFNSTLTTEVLEQESTSEMLHGGFFGRIIFIPGKDGKRPRRTVPEDVFYIRNSLKKASSRLSEADLKLEFRFSEEALELINQIELRLTHRKLKAIASRYAHSMIKIAAILKFNDTIVFEKSNRSKGSKSDPLSETLLQECTEKSQDGKSNRSRNSSFSPINPPSTFDPDDFGCYNPNDEYSDSTTITTNTINTNYTMTTSLTPSIIEVESRYVQEAYEMILPCIEFMEKVSEYAEMNKKYIIKFRRYVEENYPVSRRQLMQFQNMTLSEVKSAEDTLGSDGMERIRSFYVQFRKKNGTLSKPSIHYCLYLPPIDKCQNCKYNKVCGRF